ncbi:hypothetical protein Esti_003139 [Eimeria stiedai]
MQQQQQQRWRGPPSSSPCSSGASVSRRPRGPPRPGASSSSSSRGVAGKCICSRGTHAAPVSLPTSSSSALHAALLAPSRWASAGAPTGAHGAGGGGPLGRGPGAGCPPSCWCASSHSSYSEERAPGGLSRCGATARLLALLQKDDGDAELMPTLKGPFSFFPERGPPPTLEGPLQRSKSNTESSCSIVSTDTCASSQSGLSHTSEEDGLHEMQLQQQQQQQQLMQQQQQLVQQQQHQQRVQQQQQQLMQQQLVQQYRATTALDSRRLAEQRYQLQQQLRAKQQQQQQRLSPVPHQERQQQPQLSPLAPRSRSWGASAEGPHASRLQDGGPPPGDDAHVSLKPTQSVPGRAPPAAAAAAAAAAAEKRSTDPFAASVFMRCPDASSIPLPTSLLRQLGVPAAAASAAAAAALHGGGLDRRHSSCAAVSSKERKPGGSSSSNSSSIEQVSSALSSR